MKDLRSPADNTVPSPRPGTPPRARAVRRLWFASAGGVALGWTIAYAVAGVVRLAVETADASGIARPTMLSTDRIVMAVDVLVVAATIAGGLKLAFPQSPWLPISLTGWIAASIPMILSTVLRNVAADVQVAASNFLMIMLPQGGIRVVLYSIVSLLVVTLVTRWVVRLDEVQETHCPS